MRRKLIAALGLGLTLTACGSTVQLGAQTGGTGALDQSGLGSDLGGSAPVDGGATAGPDGTPAAGGDSTPTPGATETSDPGTITPGDGGGVSNPTVPSTTVVDYSKPATGSPVKVGIMYIPDLGAAAGQFGGSGEDNTDQRGYMQAAADYMNAHGGLGGHKIQMLYYPAQIAGAKSYATSLQEYCAMMTQDNHVVAGVIANITVNNDAAECLNKKKAMYVTDGGYFKTTADWSRIPYMVSPTEIDTDMLGRKMADFTVEKGAAKKGDTVGVLAYDSAPYHSAVVQFTNRAKALGLKVVSSEIHYATSTPDLANSIAQIQSAELAMKARGVTTVVSLCTGGCMGYFLKNAESQEYYPRYVFKSIDTVAGAPAAATGKQLKGAIALGWQPIVDVDIYKDPAQFNKDATFNTCKAIEKAKSTPDYVTYTIALRVCESLLLVQSAAKGYRGSDITGTTLLQGLGQLGSSISSGGTWSTKFTPTKHWAPNGYRSMHYEYNLEKFVYDSGLQPF